MFVFPISKPIVALKLFVNCDQKSTVSPVRLTEMINLQPVEHDVDIYIHIITISYQKAHFASIFWLKNNKNRHVNDDMALIRKVVFTFLIIVLSRAPFSQGT